MNQPLGRMVGNACEVNESMEVLEGGGPADVVELTIELCVPLLIATGRAADASHARAKLSEAIRDGRALKVYQKMIEAQGGKFSERLPLAAPHDVLAPRSGYVARFDGQNLGHCVVAMGGGRRQQMDAIDHRVGLEMLTKIGDRVKRASR